MAENHNITAPSGVRAWVESPQEREAQALAEASNLLGCKEYAQHDLFNLHLVTSNTTVCDKRL